MNDPAPRIRRAGPANADLLTSVIAAAYAPIRASGVALPAVEEGVAEDIATHHAWVAEAKGRVLAGIIAARNSNGVHILNLAVQPSSGGRGLGRALLRTVEAWARSEGILQMRLATHVDMEATRAFYSSLGWQEAGREGKKIYFQKHVSQT